MGRSSENTGWFSPMESFLSQVVVWSPFLLTGVWNWWLYTADSYFHWRRGVALMRSSSANSVWIGFIFLASLWSCFSRKRDCSPVKNLTVEPLFEVFQISMTLFLHLRLLVLDSGKLLFSSTLTSLSLSRPDYPKSLTYYITSFHVRRTDLCQFWEKRLFFRSVTKFSYSFLWTRTTGRPYLIWLPFYCYPSISRSSLRSVVFRVMRIQAGQILYWFWDFSLVGWGVAPWRNSFAPHKTVMRIASWDAHSKVVCCVRYRCV